MLSLVISRRRQSVFGLSVRPSVCPWSYTNSL